MDSTNRFIWQKFSLRSNFCVQTNRRVRYLWCRARGWSPPFRIWLIFTGKYKGDIIATEIDDASSFVWKIWVLSRVFQYVLRTKDPWYKHGNQPGVMQFQSLSSEWQVRAENRSIVRLMRFVTIGFVVKIRCVRVFWFEVTSLLCRFSIIYGKKRKIHSKCRTFKK